MRANVPNVGRERIQFGIVSTDAVEHDSESMHAKRHLHHVSLSHNEIRHTRRRSDEIETNFIFFHGIHFDEQRKLATCDVFCGFSFWIDDGIRRPNSSVAPDDFFFLCRDAVFWATILARFSAMIQIVGSPPDVRV